MKIVFYGEIAEKFGGEWDLDVRTPIEAVQAIGYQKAGFFETLNDPDQYYQVFTGETLKELFSPDELFLPAKDVIIFSPTTQGEGGSPFLRILTGALFVGAALLIPGGVSVLGLNLGSSTLGLIGGALILSGVSQILSPQKKIQEKKKEESQIISGNLTAVQQGARVPVVYGEMLLSDPLAISYAVREYQQIQIGDDGAIYKQLIQAELPFEAQALQNYVYKLNPKTYKPLNAAYLTNRDPYTGMVVEKGVYDSLQIGITFSSSPSGAAIASQYIIQRVKISTALEGFTGANYLVIQDGYNNVLLETNLSGGWNDIYVGHIGYFNVPRDYFKFIFYTNNPDYIGVGEIQLFGAVGLNDISYIKP